MIASGPAVAPPVTVDFAVDTRGFFRVDEDRRRAYC